MSTRFDARSARDGETTRSIGWIAFFGAFVFALVAFAVVREARLTTAIVLPVAVIMLAGLAYDRFCAGHAAGRIVGVILTVIAFAGGAVTGLLLPT
jgi:uncharacterized membrane protein YsdA (DUF1294 family)